MLEPIEQLVVDLLVKGVQVINNSYEIVFAEHKGTNKGRISVKDLSLHIYPPEKEIEIMGPPDKVKKYISEKYSLDNFIGIDEEELSSIKIKRGDSPIIELLMKRFWV